MPANRLTPTDSAVVNISFTPSSEIHRAFIRSTSFINIAYGPRGESKSTSGLFACIWHALQQGEHTWPLRWALIRDTRRNIGLTTARTLLEWFPRPYSHWRGKEDEPESITLFIENSPAIIFDCFGVNTPQDLSRFQSYEASGGIWIEEPAPAATNAEMISTGISEKTLATAITSVRGAKHPRIQLTFNPPSANHWTAQLFHLPGYDEAGDLEDEMDSQQREARKQVRAMSAVFFFAPGSNAALDEKTPGYRERNRIALMATGATDMLARFVEGRVSYARIGAAVTPEFSGSHIIETSTPVPGRPFYIGWDFGLYHACTVAQVIHTGHLVFHAAFYLENAGTAQIIDRRLRPWLLSHPEVTTYIHIGGYEATQREQRDSDESALKEIQRTLGGRYIPGPVSWKSRAEACHDALEKHIGGVPWVRVSRTHAAPLIRCLDGGWYYPTDVSGNVSRELPDKRGSMPSLGDAFAHTVARLLPPSHGDRQRSRERREPQQTRVSVYGGVYKGRTGV